MFLDKLHKIGIRGNVHCLPKSYLVFRSQYVSCNGGKSDVKLVESNANYGSILGPLLFILFMKECFSFIDIFVFYGFFTDDKNILSGMYKMLIINQNVKKNLKMLLNCCMQID